MVIYTGSAVRTTPFSATVLAEYCFLFFGHTNFQRYERIPRDINARPRHLYRSYADRVAAEEYQAEHGYLFSEYQEDHSTIIESYPCDLSNWRRVHILKLEDGFKLAKKAGLYGFFNLSKDALPTEKILYIGMSTKIDQRVTKNHGVYCRALACNATHVGFITYSDTSLYGTKKIKRLLERLEKSLIQHWSPYLNIEENVFNYKFEPLRFGPRSYATVA